MLIKRIFTILFFIININGYSLHTVENDKDIQKAELYYLNGIEFGKAGKLDSALVYALKAVELYEESRIKDSTFLAYSYQSLGIIYYLLGKYTSAINCYNKAEEIYESANNNSLLAYIYGNKANIFHIQQDYTKAKDFNLRAISIFKIDSVNYKKQLAYSYNNLGESYKSNKNFHEAINFFYKSLSLKDKNELTNQTFGNLAYCYEKLGDFNKAEKYYLQAIEFIKDNFGKNNIWLAYEHMNYGKFLTNQNRKEREIMKFYKASLHTFKANFGEKHPDLSACYNSIGEFYLGKNKLDSALHYFQESLIALSDNFNDSRLDSNPSIDNVLSKTHLLNSLNNKAHALSKLAYTKNNIEYYILSLDTYDATIQTIHTIRSGFLSEESKLFLAENAFDIFSNAVQTSYALYLKTNKQEYLDKAFYYSESGKSAILHEAMQNTKALNIGGIPDSLIIREKQLEKSIWSYEELIYEENKKKVPKQNRLEYWNRFLFEQKQEYAELSELLENNYKKYHELKRTNSRLSIDDIQKQLSKKDVLIEYYLCPEKLYTFLIEKNKSSVLEQDIDTNFYNHLDFLLNGLSNNKFSNHGYEEFDQYQTSSFFIYNVVLKPIEDKLRNKNLIIIPDGKLAYLPFEVLTTENKKFDRIRYKNLAYFVYKNNISYSYSAGFLFEKNHNTRIAERKLGAFAPTYSNIEGLSQANISVRQQYREKLFPLKGIKEEVHNISELIGGDKYLDFNANEKKFKEVASLYDILHLAMHTIIDDQNPMYSKMAFTQGNDSVDDGFLNTYELYNMKLNSRMAVLSSCNSGSGKLQRGEGVMSLARGFIYSGCPSIVMTLWSVEDKSGVNLMTNFYKYLLKGKTKAESLNKSKIDFIDNADQLHAHPYFWSGYVVIGNNKPLFRPYLKYTLWFGILTLTSIVLFLLLKYIKRKKDILKRKNFVFKDVAYN